MTEQQEKVIKEIVSRKVMYFSLKAASITEIYKDEDDYDVVFYRVNSDGVKLSNAIIVGMGGDGDIYRIETREHNPYVLKAIIEALLGEE